MAVGIWFSDLKRTNVIEVPVLPEELPKLSKASKNEEFETFNDGTYNFIGNVGLVTFPLERFLPEYAGKYKWAKSQIDPYILINLWSDAMENKTPLRIVINRNKVEGQGEEVLNWMVSVEAMDWWIERTGDIGYALSLKEYREIGV